MLASNSPMVHPSGRVNFTVKGVISKIALLKSVFSASLAGKVMFWAAVSVAGLEVATFVGWEPATTEEEAADEPERAERKAENWNPPACSQLAPAKPNRKWPVRG